MSSSSGYSFPSYDPQNYGQGYSGQKYPSSGNSAQYNLNQNSNHSAFLQPSSSAGFSGSENLIITASHAMLLQNESYLSLYTQNMRLQCELEAQG